MARAEPDRRRPRRRGRNRGAALVLQRAGLRLLARNASYPRRRTRPGDAARRAAMPSCSSRCAIAAAPPSAAARPRWTPASGASWCARRSCGCCGTRGLADAPCRFDVVEASGDPAAPRTRTGSATPSARDDAETRMALPARRSSPNWPRCWRARLAHGRRYERLAYGDDNSRRHALPDAVAMPRPANRSWRWYAPVAPTACRSSPAAPAPAPPARRCPTHGGIVRVVRAHGPHPRDPAGRPLRGGRTGVLNGDLQQALVPHGLFWPPDPSSAELLQHRRQPRLQCRRPARGEVRRQPRQRAGARRRHRHRRTDRIAAAPIPRTPPATT